MKIRNLQNLEFIPKQTNIVFIGTSGVGKTHLATSLGIESAKKRHSTYFIKCNTLLMNLLQAYNENRLEVRLRHYRKYKVLIIDEIGFLPIGELESNLLFQLIDMRYEFRPTIVTSNISLDRWHTIFPNITIANAIIDRLLHHSEIFNIVGESYRLKDLKSEVN